MTNFDEFWRGYCSAMCLTALEEHLEASGSPLFPCQGEFTDNYDGVDELVECLSPAEIAELRADCEGFISEAGDMIAGREYEAGCDFHFTRNRHGAGFWDGDWGDNGDKLTEIAHCYGSCELYGNRMEGTVYAGLSH